MNKNKKIYYDSFEDAIERNRKKIPENINKGMSVIKGINATFAPALIP